MLRPTIAAMAIVLAVVVGSLARADTLLQAIMTNAGEPGGVTPTLTAANGGGPRPASFGTATFVLNTAQTAMTLSATVNNLDFTGSQTADPNDNLVAAHIHASATVTPTTNAGVVWGFIPIPSNDNNPPDAIVTPFATGVGGTVTAKWDAPEGNGTTLAAQVNNLLTTHAYINFHTTQFPGGEIRGMITVIPEPSTMVLVGLGALGFVARRLWRGRRWV